MKRARRCPRCRSLPRSYLELWTDFSMRFGADANGCAEEIGYTIDGRPFGVVAECVCGHSWRLRGVRQITDLQERS